MLTIYRPSDPDPRHFLDFSKERILFPANTRHLDRLQQDLAETEIEADLFVGKTPHWVFDYAAVATLIVIDVVNAYDAMAAGLIHAHGRSGKVIVSMFQTDIDESQHSYVWELCSYYGILPHGSYESLADGVLLHCQQPRKYRNVLDALK
jgi:hypothetical protein